MRHGRARALVGIPTALLLLALLPASAGASFHFMKVREVFPSTGDEDFVELQMFSSGQNFVSGHTINVYDAAGSIGHPFTMNANVNNGENQRTVLIGDTAAAGFPDFTDPGLDIPAAGGAVCFPDAEPQECVTWGTFVEQAGFPNHQTANAPAIPAGMSLTRDISGGVDPNLLENADDTDHSANDFDALAPSPSCNRASPIGSLCTAPPPPPPGPPGPGPGPSPGQAPDPPGTPPPPGTDVNPPNTIIGKAPKRTIEKDKAKIVFSSSEPGSLFACKLDKAAFKACTSPKTYRNLKDGKHKVLVQATDLALNTDPTPAVVKFKVDTGP